MGRANLGEACSALLAAKQRTALALVGIVIGVASVSAMISVGTIVRSEAARQFQELGTDIANVRLRARDPAGGRVSIELSDAEGVVTLSGIRAAAPYTLGSLYAVLGGTEPRSVSVVGATDALADLARLRLAQGRFVSVLDGTGHFCTVGADLGDALRDAGVGVIGAGVEIQDTVFTVAGVLERAAYGRRPFDPNKTVFIPVAAAARSTPKATLRDILVRMSAGAYYRDVAAQVQAWFRSRAPAAQVRFRSAEELIEHMHQEQRLYTLLLGAVGGISLLVGGIGVMNVMLVAVTERRTEIGVRRALGARRRDIQTQFLVESMILSLLGGIVGVVLGIVATYGICSYAGWVFEMSAPGMLLGAGVAGGAGIFFGLYPAHQAARLDPVAALHGT